MIKIITGEKESGKSTTFLQMYRETVSEAVEFSAVPNKKTGFFPNSGIQPRNVGVYAHKLHDNDRAIIGYNLVLLPGGKELPFISLKESIAQENLEDYLLQGRFAFLKESFRIAEKHILDSLSNGATTVWIDEVGNLELKGMGYDALLKTLFESGINITFTVRCDLLQKVIERYTIKKYLLIDLPAGV